jgi:hypothetical protein
MILILLYNNIGKAMGSNVPKRTVYGRYKLKPSIIWLVYCCFTNMHYPQIIQVIRRFYSSTILVLKPMVAGGSPMLGNLGVHQPNTR